eukprot:scaffold11159_cov157-Amphora_coffeaeformis.AAC.4
MESIAGLDDTHPRDRESLGRKGRNGRKTQCRDDGCAELHGDTFLPAQNKVGLSTTATTAAAGQR